MHLCHGETVWITQNKNKEQDSCPICNQSSEDEPASTLCSDEQHDCCQDIQVDLKKGEQGAENRTATLSFLALSPAVLTLHWITVCHLLPQDESWIIVDRTERTAYSSPPPYLMHRNFRI
ncbi:hypothetical protein [Sphingobacterium suaedae]|uniref:Uncharacterized protein n=1 Tax=Sphingobacterium suaedae TaxID=1686402 RepID=A0ABW5KGL2_9SPHI